MATQIETIVDASIIRNVESLARQFSSAKPFRHIVIENFFLPRLLVELQSDFPAFESGNSTGDDGIKGGKSTVERIRALGPGYVKLDEAIQTPEFLNFIGALTGIDGLLYDPFYLGGGTHENRQGQSLQAHVDFNYHPSERWHRRLNLIVYLNPDWDEAWGGNLELYADPYQDAAPSARIVPMLNRCVVFETTERSWHGFDEIRLPADRAAESRKSIALYFYSKTRPAREIAGKHTTHYVNRQLPAHLVEGYRLTAADVHLVRQLIANRDNQMQRLYEENSSLRQAQERGIGGQLLYLLRRFYVRYRR